MSLKAFHLFFIVVSIVFTVGFGVWSLRSYLAEGPLSGLVLALASFGGAICLVIYGRAFLAKTKDMGYL